MHSYCSLVFSYVKGSFVLIWDILLLKLCNGFNFNPRQYIVEAYWFYLATMYPPFLSFCVTF